MYLKAKVIDLQWFLPTETFPTTIYEGITIRRYLPKYVLKFTFSPPDLIFGIKKVSSNTLNDGLNFFGHAQD